MVRQSIRLTPRIKARVPVSLREVRSAGPFKLFPRWLAPADAHVTGMQDMPRVALLVGDGPQIEPFVSHLGSVSPRQSLHSQ